MPMTYFQIYQSASIYRVKVWKYRKRLVYLEAIMILNVPIIMFSAGLNLFVDLLL